MLEIVNKLSPRRYSEIDDFFTYFGMYEDRTRTKVLMELLKDNARRIKGGVCVEAGAGLGGMARYMLKLGAARVYCVEGNPLCARSLEGMFRGDKRVRVVNARIERFRPPEKVDVLFQELYGPMLLDESLLALDRLRFSPALVLPNEGGLIYEEASLASFKDRLIDKKTLGLLEGALVTDLFLKFNFRAPKTALEWRYGGQNRSRARVRLDGRREVLAFGIEVRHDGRRLCGTADCLNWPYVFAPSGKGTFEISYRYRDCYADVIWGKR